MGTHRLGLGVAVGVVLCVGVLPHDSAAGPYEDAVKRKEESYSRYYEALKKATTPEQKKAAEQILSDAKRDFAKYNQKAVNDREQQVRKLKADAKEAFARSAEAARSGSGKTGKSADGKRTIPTPKVATGRSESRKEEAVVVEGTFEKEVEFSGPKKVSPKPAVVRSPVPTVEFEPAGGAPSGEVTFEKKKK